MDVGVAHVKLMTHENVMILPSDQDHKHFPRELQYINFIFKFSVEGLISLLQVVFL